MPADWIEHRRGDGERIGWMVPAGEGFHVIDLLGRRRTETPVEWLQAEEALDALGIGYLAERYLLTMPDGVERPVRIGEASERGIVVVADEFGSASAVGANPERITLPFPAPAVLRQIAAMPQPSEPAPPAEPAPPSGEPDPPADDQPEPKPRKPRRRIGWIITVILLGLALIATATLLVLSLMRLDEAQTKIEQQQDLIDKKETFGAAMNDLVAKANEFDGVLFGSLVPHDTHEVLASRGWTHRWDAAALVRDTEAVRTATGDLEAVLAAAREQAAENTTGSRYEAVIDKLGGGFVSILIDNADKLCESDVLGCVISDDPYTVHFDKKDTRLPYMTNLIRDGISYHEFAHVLQMTNPAQTRTALEAFDDDAETMADCYALTYLKGWKLHHTVWVSDVEYWEVDIGYGYTCNSKQRQAIRDWNDSLGYQNRPISQ